MRVPKRVALAMMSIAGLFGMRTPPEPEVVAQMQPARGPSDDRPTGPGNLPLEREDRMQRGTPRAQRRAKVDDDEENR